MSTFVKGGGTASSTFGPREFLRSTNPKPQTESYTVAKGSVPSRTVTNGDGSTSSTKVLQPGTVMAKITTGPDAGKIGPYQPEATDGRQTAANIVGLELTYLPWQLNERDVEVSVVVNATAVQAWCLELNAAGAEVPLSNAIADEMRGKKRLDINFA